MYCTNCGTQNADNVYACKSCGDALTRPSSSAYIPTYLAQSIIVTILCCMPLGIPAIVFSSQVNDRIAAGDMQGAMESSRKAKVWCWWSFGVALVGNALAIIIPIVFVLIAILFENGDYLIQ